MKDEETRLLTIGEFAARTRLAPSALRYYRRLDEHWRAVEARVAAARARLAAAHRLIDRPRRPSG